MAVSDQSSDSPAATGLERLPDRRPASLYDVAVQYSMPDGFLNEHKDTNG